MNRFVRPIVGLLAAAVLSIAVDVVSGFSRTAVVNGQVAMTGVVHEAKPSEDRKVAEVRVQVAGSSSDPAATDAEGRFTVTAAPGTVIEFSKAGYEPARITIREAGASIDV